MTEPAGRGVRHPRLPVAAALLAAFLASVALRWWLVRDVAGPAQFADEAGYLGNARWLAGEGPTWPMGRAPYYSFGYSLVLAPLFRLIADPGSLHRATLIVNALLLSSLVPILYVLVRRGFGAAAGPALAAAVAGSIVPAAVSQAAIGWSENLALPLFAAVLVALWLATTERPGWQRLWIGPATVWLYATHPRFTAVVPVVVGALVLARVAGRCPRWTVVVNVVVTVLGLVGVGVIDLWIQDARWLAITSPESHVRLGDLGSVDGLLGVGAEAVGQAWYVIAGSGVLVALGVIGLTTVIRGEQAIRAPSRWEARTVLAVATAAATAAVFATSTLFFAFERTRSDQLVYGRYNDAFVPVLAALGVAHLASVGRRVALRHVALAGIAGVVAGGVILAGRGDDAFAGPYVRPNIPAVARLIGRSPDQLVLRATLLALAAAVVVALAVAVRRPWLAVAVLGAWFVVAAASVVDGLDDYSSGYFDRWPLPDEVDELGLAPGQRVGFDLDGSKVALGAYPFWLDDLRLVPREGTGRGPAPALTFAPLRSPPWSGARVVLLDSRLGQALWVRPGPRATRLAEEGRLLPEGFPAPLPDEARAARVTLTGSTGEPLQLRPGRGAAVTVGVGHVGDASPWPDAASHTADGVVRLGARWLDGPGPRRGAEARAELPEWMVPGDEVRATIRLKAVDGDGRPLAPGRYRVGVDLVQEGFAWFVAPGRERLQLTVVVAAGAG